MNCLEMNMLTAVSLFMFGRNSLSTYFADDCSQNTVFTFTGVTDNEYIYCDT